MIIPKSFNRSDGDDGTGFLLDNLYFKENYSSTELGLRQQQALDADLKAIQQINSLNKVIIGYCNDKTNFLHKILSTERAVSRSCKAFENK